MSELRDAIQELADQYNWDPVDIATVMSYETGGTLDPWKKGPTTQWGEHRGLIQWGAPQRQKYGVTQNMSVRDQVFAAGQYFLDRGVKPGDGILPIYASINAGHASKIHASDANNGGAPGTVLDKVNNQMSGHRDNALALFAGSYTPASSTVSHSFNDATVEVPVAPEPKDYSQPAGEETGFIQLQRDAWNTEQTLAWMLEGSPDDAPDPNFDLTPERIREDLGNINADIERYADWIGDATSEKNYNEILGNIQEDRNRLQRLSDAGMTGTVLRVANSILDPVAITAEVAALAAYPPAGAALLATRKGRIANAALRGAAAGFAGEASALPFNPHRTQTDLLAGTVLGAGVGAVVGSLQKGASTGEEAIRLQRTARGLVDELEADEIPTLLANDSVGAARVNRPDQYLDEDAAEFLEDKDIAETFGSKFRFDLSAMLDKSKNPMVRVLGGLVQDGTGKKNGAINHIAPSEERMLMREEFMTSAHRTYNPAWKEYVKDLEIPLGERPRAEAKFNEEIYDYITDRSTGRSEAYHPAVVRMGNKLASMQTELLQLAQNPFRRDGDVGRSVRGFEEVKQDPHYMARMWDERRVVLANDEYVNGTIEQLIEGAMRKANADLSEDLLKRMAQKFSKGLLRRSQGVEELMMRRLGPESVDDLVKELELNSNDAANLKSWFEGRTSKDAGRDARAKRRALLSEDFALTNPRRRDGTVDDQGLSIKDLIKRNGMENFSRYADRMSGMIALARYRWKDPVTGELLVDGITSDAEWDKLKDIVRKKAADAEPSKRQSPGEIAADMKRLDLAYSSIRGRPLSESENTEFGMWARMIRKFNFSRIMNQVGFAQLSELGVTIGHLGTKASFSQVPALRRMINQDGETILQSGLADDLEVWLGVGTDRLRHQSDMRYDDLSGLHEEATGTWRDKADFALNKANQVTSEISGMTQINTMLQRWTGASIVQRFADIAKKDGKGLSDARWADLGIDGEMKDRIIAMINTEGNLEFTKGWITNNKVSRIHPSKWSDKEAAEAFRKGVYRLSNQLIQKNDIGNLIGWMHLPSAKLLMQFRTFMVGAWVKQTMKAMNFRDKEAFMSALLSMAAGGAAYVAQTKIKGIGREDQEDFYERRLSMDKIGTAAFARSGAVSIIPMLVDTARVGLRSDALFSHTRSTGQVSNMMFGNPTTGGVDDVIQASGSITGLFEDREWSAQEARNIQRILPFGNAIPMVTAVESLINAGDMPKYAPRN